MTLNRFLGNLVLVAIGVGIPAVILAPAIRESNQVRGEVFPVDPAEYRRVDTGLGMSIIRPLHWDVSNVALLTRYSSPERYHHFYMRPYQNLETTYGSSISVYRTPESPDFKRSEFTEREFQGRPAWEGYAIGRNNRFDQIESFQIHVRDGQHWFTISYSLTKKLTRLPDETKEFLESARFDEDNAVD